MLEVFMKKIQILIFFSILTINSFGENYCFKYTGTGDDSIAWITTDWITVTDGKEYELSARIKYEDFAVEKGKFVIDGWCYKDKELVKGGFGDQKIIVNNGTKAWYIIRTKIIIPAGVNRLKMALTAMGKGRVWVKEVFFAKTNDGNNLIPNGDFEDIDEQEQIPRGWKIGIYKGAPVAPSKIEWTE